MAHILIVEDSLVFSRLLNKRLSAGDRHEVAVAASLAEARQLISQNAFDLAILDLTLPDAPKGEIVDYVTAHKIPSIVFTSTFDPALREQILAKDVFDYLLKDSPDAIESVARSIERFYLNQKSAILIVDDSLTIRTHLAKMLKALRSPLLLASGGTEALHLLAEHPEIRLVITDYHMPEMDGFELVSRIRKTHPHESLAIIGVSSEGASLMSAKFLKKGANDFLTKPFSQEELYNKIALNLELIERFQVVQEQAEHLAVLNQQKNKFLGMAAHDLRNPLASIRGFSEIMLSEATGPVTAEAKEFLALIHSLSNEMLEMVNDLLDVATIESGKATLNIQNHSLTKLIRERLGINRVMATKKGIAIEEELAELTELPCDRSRISQVVDNLVSNAVKFSQSNSTVRVSLSLFTEKGTEYARVGVKDQGPGLTSEDQTKLFGEFQKLSARPTGGEKSTGLGLSIVKKIITDHGGRIWVESTPGEGAAFEFTLPLGGK